MKITVDLKNSKISLNSKSLEKKVASIHEVIQKRTGKGNEMMDWLKLPETYDKEEVKKIQEKVAFLHSKKVEKLIVVGIGGSFLGAKAGIDFVTGSLANNENILFVGTDMSASHYHQVDKIIEDKKWALCVISKSGTTLEPALAFRHYLSKLKKVWGEDYKQFLTVITDVEKGVLKNIANVEGYETFIVPDGTGGRFSGMTPVGLFPMAFAGIDLNAMFAGAHQAMNDLNNPDLSSNPAYQYAAARYLIARKDCIWAKMGLIKKIPSIRRKVVAEAFITYDFDLPMMAEWWKQLFGESEGKDGKGILPTSMHFSRDLHSLGQFVQDGYKMMFETTLWVEKDNKDVKVTPFKNNLDGLDYLNDKTIEEINKVAFEGVLDAHANQGGIPNIVITIPNKHASTLGYLWYFFFISVTMACYLDGVNPFDQPGVEVYKKNMFSLLKKPVKK